MGGVAVTGVSATLTTSTPGVTVTQGASAYPDIAAGASAANTTPFRVSLADSLPCGATLDFSLNVTSSAGTVSLPFSLVTGMTGDYADYTGSATVIGDSMPTLHRTPLAGLSGLRYTGTADGLDSRQPSRTSRSSSATSATTTQPPRDRPHRSRRHPDTLVDHRGAPGGPFSETRLARDAAAPVGGATSPFTGSFRPDGDLGAFVGAAANGTWQLVVAADTAADIGRLSRWTLRIATADCTPARASRCRRRRSLPARARRWTRRGR